MNKKDFIAKIAEHSGQSTKDVDKMLTSMIETIKDVTAGGDSIQLIGFAKFEKQHKPASTGRNPSTGASIDVPAKDVLKVTVAKNVHKDFYGQA